MDERLEQALEVSNYMVTLNNSKRFLEEAYKQDIIYYFNGGQFTVNKELICFCQVMVDREQESIVLLDDNNRPFEIEVLDEFLQNILNIYFNASNTYLTNFNKLVKHRSIKSMVDS